MRCEAHADTLPSDALRLATFHAEMSRKGPGLLLHDLTTGRNPATEAALAVIAATRADAILLLDVDFDPALVTLTALATRLEAMGHPYPHRLALPPNRAVPTGLDLDGDGRTGEPEDAQGFGRFAGQGGMAILSRLAIDGDGLRDLSGFLWADLPGHRMPATLPAEAAAILRLASSGIWEVPLILPEGGRLRLLAFHAAPPAFSDLNRARHGDELAFWPLFLEGRLPLPAPDPPFVLMGTANADPWDGEGDRMALTALLSHPALQDPAPRGSGGPPDPEHRGDPATDTAAYGRARGLPGSVRVDYVLPSADLAVIASGVLWPDEGDPLAATLAAASRHRPVWVDIVPAQN